MIKTIICSLIFFNLSVFSQTNDAAFNTFFQKFKTAVNDNNIAEISELTNFPFIFSWQNFSQTELSREEFLANPYLPENTVLQKAKFNKSVKIKQSKSESETVNFIFKEDFYIISFDFYSNIDQAGGYSEYYFGLIKDEYKYIKVISGD